MQTKFLIFILLTFIIILAEIEAEGGKGGGGRGGRGGGNVTRLFTIVEILKILIQNFY